MVYIEDSFLAALFTYHYSRAVVVACLYIVCENRKKEKITQSEHKIRQDEEIKENLRYVVVDHY